MFASPISIYIQSINSMFTIGNWRNRPISSYSDWKTWMTWCNWAFIQAPKTIIDRRSDILIVLFKEHEMCVTPDTNVGKPDPLIIGKTHLLEVLEETMVVRDVWAGFACDHDVRHFADLSKFVDCSSLKDARALGQVVLSHLHRGDG